MSLDKVYNVIIDLTNDSKNKVPQITFNKNDRLTSIIAVKLNIDGAALDLTGKSVDIYIKKPDEKKVFSSMQIVDAAQGILFIELPTQSLTAAGICSVELRIQADNEVRIPASFSYTVLDSIIDDSVIESTNEFSALTDKINEVNKIIEDGITGIQGPAGEQGPMGPVGPAGPKGDAFVYEDFTQEQLEALKGPQGPIGERGQAGPEGKGWLYGTSEPAANLGRDGDLYYKHNTCDVYRKNSGSWQLSQNLRGAVGATGPQGPAGPAGATGERGPQGSVGPQGPKGDAGLTPEEKEFLFQSVSNGKTAIAAAITGKGVTTAADASFEQMATNISAISSGSSSLPFEVPYKIGIEAKYAFANEANNWIVENYPLNTSETTNMAWMFHGNSVIENIPLFDTSKSKSIENMFFGCTNLKTVPNFNTSNVIKFSQAFYNCVFIEELPDLDISKGTNLSSMINGCRRLKNVPRSILDNCFLPNQGYYYQFYNYGFYCCSRLTELLNLDIKDGYNSSDNVFYSTFNECSSLRRVTFKTEADGSPVTTSMTGQTIDLSYYVGYFPSPSYAESYASDIEWTTNAAESFYNHDSMVETINSLPIVNNCTIKFKSACGGNLLTPEEIAVAANKGWTVSLI